MDDIDRAAAEARKVPFFKRTKEHRKALNAYDLREMKRSLGEARQMAGELRADHRQAREDRKDAAATTVHSAPRRSTVRARFEGAVLDGSKGTISYKGTSVPLPATARVETAGEIRERVTVTRLVAVGVFAFALKKKTDARELYLTVEGNGAAFVMELNPKLGHQAREFAAKVNAA